MARQQHAGQKGNPSGRSAFRTEGLPYIHVPSGRHHMRKPASVVTAGIRPRHKPACTARLTIWQSAPCAPGGKTAHITMRNLRFCKPERPVLPARTARLPTAGKQPWQPPRQRRAEASAATWRNYSCLRRPTWHPQPRPAAKIALRPPAAHGLAGPQTELNRAWRPGRQAWPCAAGRTACASRGQDAYR